MAFFLKTHPYNCDEMIQIHATKRNRKHSYLKLPRMSFKGFHPVVVLIVGMGLGAMITQQVLPPAPQAWVAPMVEDVPVRVCFTPESQCTPGILNAINSAKSSIFVQAYSFTSAPIANALVEAKARGVDVQVILDKSQPTAKGSQLNTLIASHVPVSIDQVTGIAHNKVMIIDDTYVLTGSFNFTNSADTRNAENILLLQDPALAKLYKANWKTREKLSQPYP
jgi:phospholipase D